MNRKEQILALSVLIAVALVTFFPRFGLGQVQPTPVPTPAPPPADTFSVGFFVNANQSDVADGTLFITNPGTSGDALCADIYVFDPNGEMSECCGCPVPLDGLLTLSINSDLTSDPLTGVQLTDGVMKIISSSEFKPGATPKEKCNPGKAIPKATLRSSLERPAKHKNPANSKTSEGHKEEQMRDATLSSKELGSLKNQCTVISLDGSGHGVCSCGGAN